MIEDDGMNGLRQITPEQQAQEEKYLKQCALSYDLGRLTSGINYCTEKNLTIPLDWVERYNKNLKELDELNG